MNKMPRETYRPDQFVPDEIVVDPKEVFEKSGAVNGDFRPDYTDGVEPPVQAIAPTPGSNSSRWRVRGDLGDLSGRGEPVDGTHWPHCSRIAIISPSGEDFPRNA